MAKYTFFWKTGKREVLEGRGASDALNSKGYGSGAIAALDFFSVGNNQDWEWNGRDWIRKGGVANV